MKLLALILALSLAVPTADAAVLATTKQKKLPVIENAYVGADLKTFGFEIAKAPTTNGYDVWAKVVGGRNKKIGQWFVKSMKLRTKSAKLPKAEFTSSLADVLAYSRPGTYVLTLFVCPSNVDRPTDIACANASTSFKKQ